MNFLVNILFISTFMCFIEMMSSLSRHSFSKMLPNCLQRSNKHSRLTTDQRYISGCLWGDPEGSADAIGQTYKQQQKGRVIYILEGHRPEGNNKKRRLCDAIRKSSFHVAVIWKEFLSYTKKQLCNEHGFSGIRSFLAIIIKLLFYM